MKKRNVLVCLTALAVSTFLGGCGGPEGPVPSKGDVAKYVKENISEKCEYVSRETVSESPKEIAYTYKSKERDLEFKVYAYRHNVGMYEMKIYKGKIRTDYEYVVRTSYDSRIQPLFEEFISDGDVKIASSDQVDKLAEAFVKANEIYREELQYNDKSFLEEHPYDNIRVVCDTAPGSTYKTYGLGYFAINGVEYDEEYYKNALDNGIAQAIKDGKISGEQYQGYEDAIEDIHVSQLDHIYLNDEEIAAVTRICCECGADYVKTATGSAGLPDVHDVEVIRENLSGHTKMKLSGVPRQFVLSACLRMIEMGVELIGTRSSCKIVDEYAKYLEEQGK